MSGKRKTCDYDGDLKIAKHDDVSLAQFKKQRTMVQTFIPDFF